MRSFTTFALLALPLFGSVVAEAPSVSKVDAIYATAQEAFQDLLNALPEESLQAALSQLKDFKTGVFESHHRGVEHVHDKNPALATKLIVAAVRDLQKRQAPANSTTPAPSTPAQPSTQVPVVSTPAQSSAAPVDPSTQAQPSTAPAPSSAAVPTTSEARAVIVPVVNTITSGGSVVVQTTAVLSEVTASVPVTVVGTNSAGSTVTTTTMAPAVIQTTTNAAGSTIVQTTAGVLQPTPGEVMRTTNAAGSTFLTTYTPSGAKISSVKLITTTGSDGRPSTITSYTFVNPAEATANGGQSGSPTTGKPGLQTNAANKNMAVGYAVVGGALAFFV